MTRKPCSRCDSAAKVAELERQLAEARDKALEEAAMHIRQSPLLWPSDAENLANEIRNLKGPTP